MAIFENLVDKKNVPLLVQLAQIDTTNDGELRHALRLAVMGTGDGRMVDKVSISFTPEILKEVADVCDLVRRALISLMRESAVPADCLVWVNETSNAVSHRFDIADNTPGFLDGATVSFYGQQLIGLEILAYERWEFGTGQFSSIVNSDLTKVILLALGEYRRTGRSIFAPCLECNNPLLLTLDSQKEHIYCSRRCADRAGQRRRYQERQKKIKNISH